MRTKLFFILALCFLLLFSEGLAEGFMPLPMDTTGPGPRPADEAYLSDSEYEDASLSVRIYADTFTNAKGGVTKYYYAHVKVAHPSQLRTCPAGGAGASFGYQTENKGTIIANSVNAVVAVNGDYYTKEHCQVTVRQGRPYRNSAEGNKEFLVIDREGNFSTLANYSRAMFKQYLEDNEGSLYNIFCFGPVLVRDGERSIDETYSNRELGDKDLLARRAAIAQLGPLEYMLIVTDGPLDLQNWQKRGVTLLEFAQLCEEAGKKLSENGCLLAYNLDGGNSADLLFKVTNPNTGALKMTRINSPDISERQVSDIIYFATLVN